MHAQHIAQMTEFHAPLVDTGKAESSLSRTVVDMFQFRVGPENVQDGAVGLPQEFEGGQQQGGITL